MFVAHGLLVFGLLIRNVGNGTSALQLIVEPPCWEMSAPDLTHFIAELGDFGHSGYVLCLDGVIAADVETYLTARPSTFENRTDQGFLKMRSKVFFMPITGESAQGLARLSENHAKRRFVIICVFMREIRLFSLGMMFL